MLNNVFNTLIAQIEYPPPPQSGQCLSLSVEPHFGSFLHYLKNYYDYNDCDVELTLNIPIIFVVVVVEFNTYLS